MLFPRKPKNQIDHQDQVVAGPRKLRLQGLSVWMKCELSLVKGKVNTLRWKCSLGLMGTLLSSPPRQLCWCRRGLCRFIRSVLILFRQFRERVFHETVWEMEQVPRMGIFTAMIFHLAAVCSCLGVIIILSETCILAFPGGGVGSFTHIERNFPITHVSLQD